MDHDQRHGCLVLLGVVALVAFVVTVKVVRSRWESEAYNRLTGAQTTWWDAMWLELRVQDAPHQQPEARP